MSVQKSRRRFTPDFKLRAIDLSEEIGVKTSAEKLGLDPSTIYNWQKQLTARGVENAFPGNGKLPPDETKLRNLERENRRLREDLEILKKAAAFFAQHSR